MLGKWLRDVIKGIKEGQYNKIELGNIKVYKVTDKLIRVDIKEESTRE